MKVNSNTSFEAVHHVEKGDSEGEISLKCHHLNESKGTLFSLSTVFKIADCCDQFIFSYMQVSLFQTYVYQ